MDRIPLNQYVPLLASKWIEFHLFLTPDEMRTLFDDVGIEVLFQIAKPASQESERFDVHCFLDAYEQLIQSGKVASERAHFLTGAASVGESSFCAVEVAGSRFLVKNREPVLHMKPCFFLPNHRDRKVHVGIGGNGSYLWGMTFTFPQLYQTPEREIRTFKESDYPNKSLFEDLRKWVRHNTIAAKFDADGNCYTTTLRMGKEMLERYSQSAVDFSWQVPSFVVKR